MRVGDVEAGMLRLLVGDIERFWPEIERTITVAISNAGYNSPDTMANIYKALLSGRLQCWVCATGDLETRKSTTHAMILTEVALADFTLVPELFIYALANISDEPVSSRVWLYWANQLADFGRSHGCKYLTGITRDPSIASFLRRYYGAEAIWTYAHIPIGSKENG